MAYFLYKKIRDKRRQQPALEPWTKSDSYPLESNNTSAAERCSPSPGQHLLRHDEEAAISKEEKSATRKYRWRLIAGLFLPATIQALNTTMIAGALTFIASDFNQLSQLNWIVSAYNLTSAAFIPFFGQMADVFGRYLTLQASLLVMILGSALCAGAPTSNFPMFLAGRGLEGAGSAGLLILSEIALADKVSLKDNAKNNTIFTLVIGISYSVGPVIGGYLTAVSWRWVFIINIPLAVAGMVILHFLTRPVLLGAQDIQDSEPDSIARVSRSATIVKRLSTIDYGGQVLFLFGIGLLVLALTWAGSYYPWTDAKVLGPLVSGAILTLCFVACESLLSPGRTLAVRLPYQRTMIPVKLLWSRNGGILAYINFITGMAMYAVFYFAALYFTLARGFAPDKAGTSLIFYLPGLGVGALMASFTSNSWPRKTWYPLAFGTVVEAVGITLIAAAIHWGHLPTVYGMLALTGVGTGIRLMPGTLHGVGYYRKQIASVVSVMAFAHSLGGTLASTIMLNIFNNKLSGAGVSLVHGGTSSSFQQIADLPSAEQAFIRDRAAHAIAIAFHGISAFMWLGVVAMVFLGNVDIKKDVHDTSDDGETNVAYLTRGAYLMGLFRPRESNAVGERRAKDVEQEQE